ncbi:response regulator [Pseudomonas sp. ICBG1301]|uniref:response regulator n=1 Tax=Pseudomonas sp. ICBG1301 TaxID=2795987 RepID=UPI0019646C2A|nr:response regulator [Pseudomonas sp. ICBG1301]MBM9487147.1 response regulator [Pseudomonas sp. ICBG1301]
MRGNKPGGGPPKPSSADDLPGHWRHAKVLVVDDHATYRLLMSGLLDKLGVAHRVVNNGQAALDSLATDVFDLVISDCRMPVMDGYTMTRELRRREREAGNARVPVIALTARLDPEDVRHCLACEMDGWLSKPVSLARLREVLMQWLSDAHVHARQAPRGPANSRCEPRPTRASLVATFGAWEVVEQMLRSLIDEARNDLAGLALAQASLDAALTAHHLHRLVGGVAFLGATPLEPQAVRLMDDVQRSGVADCAVALGIFREDVERYLQYLGKLQLDK